MGGKKQPFFIHRPNGLTYLAGLYKKPSKDAKDDKNEYVIITGPAEKSLSEIHARMPIVLTEAEVEKWLDVKSHPFEEVDKLLEPTSDLV